MNTRMKFLQTGVSLLEVLLAVGIGTVILLVTIYLYSIVQSDTKVSKSVALLQKISSASYEWLQAQKQLDFCGSTVYPPTSLTDCPATPPSGKTAPVRISMQALLNNKLITPADTCVGGIACLLTPWGTQIEVEPAVPMSGVTATGAQYIRVWLRNVPNLVICNQIREDMKSVSATGVQANCTIVGSKIDYYVEL